MNKIILSFRMNSMRRVIDGIYERMSYEHYFGHTNFTQEHRLFAKNVKATTHSLETHGEFQNEEIVYICGVIEKIRKTVFALVNFPETRDNTDEIYAELIRSIESVENICNTAEIQYQ